MTGRVKVRIKTKVISMKDREGKRIFAVTRDGQIVSKHKTKKGAVAFANKLISIDVKGEKLARRIGKTAISLIKKLKKRRKK